MLSEYIQMALIALGIALIYALLPAEAKSIEQPPSTAPKVEILSEAIMVRVTYYGIEKPQCMFWWLDHAGAPAQVYLVECPKDA